MQIPNFFPVTSQPTHWGGPVTRVTTPVASASADSANANAGPAGTGVSNYDFTNMTPDALKTTVNDLVKSGKLSLKDSSPLVTIAGFGGGDANKPIDVVAALKAGIAFKQQAQAGQPDAGIEQWQNALAALQGLQGTASGVDTYA